MLGVGGRGGGAKPLLSATTRYRGGYRGPFKFVAKTIWEVNSVCA